MTSLTWNQITDSLDNKLSIPNGLENLSTAEAALQYAAAGWYVVPIIAQTKHAGSYLGKGWPEKSSKDPEVIRKWFSNSELGLALHVGKSGAICFDVDDPSCLPYRLREWLDFEETPFQSTRIDCPLRGHFLFATEPGRVFGNSKGNFKGNWGEVRGKNGIIVVSPSVHSKHEIGGRYSWIRTGSLPYLPYQLQQLLPQSHLQTLAALDLKEVEEFFHKYSNSECPQLLEQRISESNSHFVSNSRHDAARNLLMKCLKDSMAGLYDSKTAVEAIADVFLRHKPQKEWTSPSEFIDMTRWAIAQACATDTEEFAVIRDTALTVLPPHFKTETGN